MSGNEVHSANGLSISPADFKLVSICPSVDSARLRSLAGKRPPILSNLEGTDCL